MTPMRRLGFAALCSLIGCGSALAEVRDTVKVAIGQKGVWDSLVTVLGVDQGLFKAENIDVEILWTQGGAETLQAALTGSVDFALTNGILGVIGAYAKGAPVRIVSAEMTGSSDLYWYVRADRTPHSVAELAGRAMAYSRQGSSSHLTALALAEAAKIKPQFIPTGEIAATRTLVMSGQIDAGWAVPPFNLDLVADSKIRIIGRGSDVPAPADQTVRVNVSTAQYLASHRDIARRFLKAYAASVEAMYADTDRTIALYARENKISVDLARQSLAFYPKEALAFLPVKGLALSLTQALQYKMIDTPMSEDEAKGMTDLVYEPGS
jgi:NitT/TauT family transport system substrate-binding protein